MTAFSIDGSIENPKQVLRKLDSLDTNLEAVEEDVFDLHENDLITDIKINKNALTDESLELLEVTVKDK